MAKATCGVCGITWTLTQGELTDRLERSKSKKLFCGRECLSKHLKQTEDKKGKVILRRRK